MGTKVVARTIDNPEFINIAPYNPLISKCEIKVLYIGQNRNRSYISKEVATEMANSLPGSPIVGYYREEKEDFADHGEKIIIDDEGIKFECMTTPYGFVAPNAKVWFQKFEEEDEFGNKIEREYLMTTGYLWTGQFEEAQKILEGGRPQSMEIDEETLKGHWSTDNNSGLDFFIINDAIFSKLCILGDDVEPCFEGASITKPEVSSTFTRVDENFKKTLFTMMNELKFILEEGGEKMLDNNEVIVEETSLETQEVVDTQEEVSEPVVEVESEVTVAEEVEEVVPVAESEFTKEEEEKDDDNKEEEEEKSDDKEKDKEDKYSLLETEFSNLQSEYDDLKAKYEDLLAFKLSIEKQEKEELIESFYMLNDEDKEDVRTNIDKYSLDEIESKLSVICVRKKVNFNLENDNKNQTNIEDVVTTFTIEETESSVPAWIRAVKENEDI